MQQPSVLIARDNGVLVVPGAVPVSHGWVAAVDGLATLLETPPPQHDTRTPDRTDVRE